jgi:hypothetical protein
LTSTVRTDGWRSLSRNGPVPFALKLAGVLDPLAAVDRALGLVVLAPLLAHHRQRRQRVGQDRIRRRGLDLDGEVADLAHLLDRIGVALHVRALAGRALEREHHVVGRERRAVVEFHARAQVESPDRRALLRPLGRQRRREVHALVALDQRLVDVAGEAQLQALVERVRIHRLTSP